MSSSDNKLPPTSITNLTIPFTLYDFFGYLLPGIIFWMLLILSADITYLFTEILLTDHKISIELHFKVFTDAEHFFQKSPWFVSGSAILISYISGHFISTISSFFGERLFVENIIKYPASNLFESNEPGFWNKVFEKYSRSYSKEFQEEYKKRFALIFKITNPTPNDLFWISFEYIAQFCPNAFARSMHFLNLYGFNRNISYAFILSGIFSFVILCSINREYYWVIPGLLIVLSIPFYWNYLKLLRRLNDEVFRAFFMHTNMSN